MFSSSRGPKVAAAASNQAGEGAKYTSMLACVTNSSVLRALVRRFIAVGV
jgi:hypothetical protein